MQIPSSDFELLEEIGSGGFGTIYRAKWLTYDISIAVKQLHSTHLSNETERVFSNELSLLSRVRHPHIVTLYGACLEKQRYALIMEYMPLGSLYKLLHVENVIMPWSDRYFIALQTVRGINYLHQYQETILHRDIKSANLLLKKSAMGYLVKICDFGIAKTRNETTRQDHGNISVALSLSWTAPEILNLHPYTEKSDIYSLAIVFWELATNRIPYDGHQNNVIREFVLAACRLEIPSTTPSKFYIIVEKCWAHQPEKRPNCTCLLEMINECIQEQSKSYHSYTQNDSFRFLSS